MACQQAEDSLGPAGVLSFTHEQADQATLGNWTGCEKPFGGAAPLGSCAVMDVVKDHQRNKDVAVQEMGHSSWVTARTISVVTR